MKVFGMFLTLVALCLTVPTAASAAASYFVTDLGSPSPSQQGVATGSSASILSTGQVLTVSLPNDVPHIFSVGSSTVDLGTPLSSLPNTVYGLTILGGNSRGQILVLASSNGLSSYYAFDGIWSPFNPTVVGNGWMHIRPVGINDAGVICAFAFPYSTGYVEHLITLSPVTVSILTPANGSSYSATTQLGSNSLTFDFLAAGASRVTWSVDDGTEIAMVKAGQNHWLYSVNLSGWTWTGPLGGYKHKIIARSYDNVNVVQASSQTVFSVTY